MSQQLANGKQQFLDGNGNPLAGGSVAFYQPGTLNPINTYQDQGLTTPNPNPVIIDANGFAVIWGADGSLYRQIVKDAGGITYWDEVVGSTIGNSGTTASRPTPTVIGQPYFDLTLGQPIWCSQVSPPIWVNAAGVAV